jgi:hypothetical protein
MISSGGAEEVGFQFVREKDQLPKLFVEADAQHARHQLEPCHSASVTQSTQIRCDRLRTIVATSCIDPIFQRRWGK